MRNEWKSFIKRRFTRSMGSLGNTRNNTPVPSFDYPWYRRRICGNFEHAFRFGPESKSNQLIQLPRHGVSPEASRFQRAQLRIHLRNHLTNIGLADVAVALETVNGRAFLVASGRWPEPRVDDENKPIELLFY